MDFPPHFSYPEMIVSEIAARKGLNNTPPDWAMHNLLVTANQMEKVRTILGGLPITVNSAFRSSSVNKAVGGVSTSAHCYGYAVDFICPKFGSPFDIAHFLVEQLPKQGLKYDQIIHEYGTWVHISFDPKYRHQALTIGGKYKTYQNGILHI